MVSSYSLHFHCALTGGNYLQLAGGELWTPHPSPKIRRGGAEGRGNRHGRSRTRPRSAGNYFRLWCSISSMRLRSSISSTLPYQRSMSPDGPISGDPRERIHLHSREVFFTLYSTSMGAPDCSPSRSFLIVGSISSGCSASSHPRLRVRSLLNPVISDHRELTSRLLPSESMTHGISGF